MTRACLLFLLFLVPGAAQELTFRIPPVKASVTIDNQPIAITTTGMISGNQEVFHLRLNADLSDLQEHITGLLSSQLNRSDRCGERLSVDRATLVPMPPAGLLTAYVHYERWACVKALGKEIAKRLFGGNGTIPVKLAPSLGANNEVALEPEVGTIEADGSLGEALRSPSVGDKLRDKIGASILSAIQKGANLQAALPAAVGKAASIESVRFVDAGSGRLSLEAAGVVHISAGQVRALIEQMKAP